jgi:hypothetical protein
MPVPRRRSSKNSLSKLPAIAAKCMDIDFVFQKTKTLLLWGFAPTIVLIGCMTEPRPSPFDLINIFE